MRIKTKHFFSSVLLLGLLLSVGIGRAALVEVDLAIPPPSKSPLGSGLYLCCSVTLLISLLTVE
jgi:hypothetical protein